MFTHTVLSYVILVSLCLTDCAENGNLNRPFFLSDFLLYHYSDFWFIINHYCIMEKHLKNWEKIRTN